MSNQGEMRYTMGLDSSMFATGANQSLELISKIGRGMSSVIQAVVGEWKEMGKLSELAGMLRTTASEVYGLQRAFDAATGSSQGVNQAVAFLRRALSGTDEMGGSTAGIFADMGLDPESLKGRGAGEQISQVLAKLAELDDESKQFAARKLFGGMAQDMILASSQLDDFNAGMERARLTGESVGRMAGEAEQLGDAWSFFNAEIKQTVTQFAVELLPNMREAARLAGETRSGEIGGKVGLAASIGISGLVGAPGKIWDEIKGNPLSLISPVNLITGALTGGIESVMGAAEKKVAEAFSKAITSSVTGGEKPAPEGTRHVNRDTEAAAKKAREESARGISGSSENFSELQRMGFVVGSGAGLADFSRQTADNTRETNSLLKTYIGMYQRGNANLNSRDFSLD